MVNITNFGAFVNILPGRDGLVHISKIGGGKRIDKVEDVLTLGQEIEVRVEDIDPNGKISLIPTDTDALNAGSGGSSSGGGSSRGRSDDGGRGRDSGRPSGETDRGDGDEVGSDDATEVVTFEDDFEAQLRDEHGDLGPAEVGGGGGGGGGDRGGRSRSRGSRNRGGRGRR